VRRLAARIDDEARTMDTTLERTHDAVRPALGGDRDPLAHAAACSGAAVYLQTVLPAQQPRVELRRDADEVVYLVHGELDVWVGDRQRRLAAGMSVELPRNIPHRITNTSGRPAKVLIVSTPRDCAHAVGPLETRRGAGAGGVAAVLTPGSVSVALGQRV
jgi:uncharacterized cupin superfamily protein